MSQSKASRAPDYRDALLSPQAHHQAKLGFEKTTLAYVDYEPQQRQGQGNAALYEWRWLGGLYQTLSNIADKIDTGLAPNDLRHNQIGRQQEIRTEAVGFGLHRHRALVPGRDILLLQAIRPSPLRSRNQ
ncbi:hypothetical protein [Nitrosovibrio tenuis]|uniref:hypothetical protein n=1 Tax=Nitrosovibrio tenuis TaxID=1233 RepID=UPI0015A53CF0|nr:hypothetical protein [Nitrosovibrio tenuis]